MCHLIHAYKLLRFTYSLQKIIRFNLMSDMTYILLCTIYNALVAGNYSVELGQ